MLNFCYHNPVNIVFGKGTIAELTTLIPRERKLLITYGGGSIKSNGVYDQVIAALKDHQKVEFSGIEANPHYETLMKAVALGRDHGCDFLLAVGGGSVADGTKFIAAAMEYDGENHWDILAKGVAVTKAVPLGCVLTLPATGSEMNGNSVVTRESTQEKLFFSSPLVYPRFSILDPETTFTLPRRQTVNGIVDSFVHVIEQYLTYDVNAPLQDRQAEAILITLIEEGPKVLENPHDYQVRANIMWCATQALNGLIGCGVPQDWSTHMIAHELTALYGIDHAQTLAIVLPGVLTHQQEYKKNKLSKYAERVWQINGSIDEKCTLAIRKTEDFFHSLGVATRIKDYGVENPDIPRIAARLEQRGMKLGERQNIKQQEVIDILSMRV